MLDKKKKEAIIKKFRIHENDSGSAEVQIAILTEEIKELTLEEREIIKQQEEEREKAIKEIQEIDNWREMERKGLLTEEAEKLVNRLKEKNSEIDELTKILNSIKPDIERYYKEEEEGKKLPEPIKEDRERTISHFEQQKKELVGFKNDRERLIGELRALEQRGELVKKAETEKAEEEISEEVKAEEKEEEEKPKGIFGRFIRKK